MPPRVGQVIGADLYKVRYDSNKDDKQLVKQHLQFMAKREVNLYEERV